MPYSINLSHPNVVFIATIPLKQEKEEQFIEIYSNYEDIGLSENDNFILYSGENGRIKNSFLGYGYILSKEKKELNYEGKIGEAKAKNRFLLRINVIEDIKNIYSIEDLAYSLYKVYNYEKPWRHFTRSYSFLYKEDYDTIINGRIFLSRTAFGRFLNSLHKEHQKNFVEYFIENEKDVYFSNGDYLKAMELLIDYIENHILYPILYLKESYNKLTELVSESDLKNIGFMDDDKTEYIISKQIDYLKEKDIPSEELIKELTEFKQTAEEKFNSDLEFSEYFEKFKWPINI
jgi:hypothetical protein